MMHTPVTAAIVPEDTGAVEEKVAATIVAIYGEIPASGSPYNGMQEIVCGQKQLVLPVIEYVLEVG